MRRTSVTTGFGLGALMSLPMVALFHLGNRAFGLPFAPYDIFEWTTRWLPGQLVTAGIDAMVSVITALGVRPTSVAAKVAEKAIAIALVIAGSAVLGALVVIGRRALTWAPVVLGLVAGAIWIALAGMSEGALGNGTPVSVLWVTIVHLTWGAALGGSIQWLEAESGETGEDAAPRRRVLGILVGVAASASAAFLTLATLFRRTPAPRPAARSEELAGVGNSTSGPAASPPEQALLSRMPAVAGTRAEITPNEHFYRIDINLEPPRIDASTWRLRVEGLVDAPLSLTLDEIRALPAVSQMVTLECISNRLGGDLIGTSRWTGVRLSEVLRRARIQGGARALRIDAADGFYESVGMVDANDDRTLLVYEMNGVPLPPAHGFPLRIYIPNRHGMKQPKWIERVRATADEGTGFWVDRGWSKDAIPHTTAVIDTVGMSMMVGDAAVLPVGGIAYAGARGIRRVEVQVDDEPWTPAQLIAPPLGPLTWVLWRYDWPYRAGKHTFRVRAYDGQGVLQPVEERGPRPDGVAGIHEMIVHV